jgi:hypothetical protein
MQHKKRADGVAQMIDHPPSKCESLNSNHQKEKKHTYTFFMAKNVNRKYSLKGKSLDFYKTNPILCC